jgi:hypothetical protein
MKFTGFVTMLEKMSDVFLPRRHEEHEGHEDEKASHLLVNLFLAADQMCLNIVLPYGLELRDLRALRVFVVQF